MGFPSVPKLPRFDPEEEQRKAREARLARLSVLQGSTGRQSLIQSPRGQRRPQQTSLLTGDMSNG